MFVFKHNEFQTSLFRYYCFCIGIMYTVYTAAAAAAERAPVQDVRVDALWVYGEDVELFKIERSAGEFRRRQHTGR